VLLVPAISGYFRCFGEALRPREVCQRLGISYSTLSRWVREGRQVDVVVITYRDRLTRFGFDYLEYFFNQYGVRI